MKKIVSVLFAVFLVLGLSIPISATYTAWYYIDALEMTVPIPDDMVCLARDMSADNPILEKLGKTKEQALATFEEYDIYMQLWKKDVTSACSFYMYPSSYKDMSDFSDTDFGSFVASLTDEYDYAEVSDMLQYKTSYGTFLQFSIYTTNDSTEIFNLYYVTVYHGKKIEIELFSPTAPPTDKQKEAFKSIVDNIRFGSEDESPDKGTDTTDKTSSFTYTDKPVNTSFTVPANWYSEAVTGKDPYVTAVFVSNEDKDAVIVYGSEDQWSKYSSLGGGITRADINNDYFTEKQIEDQFEFITDVSVKYVNGVKYFTFKSRSGDQVSTSLIMFHNAVFYWFEFYGDENNKYYNDFISLIKSVKYPPVSTPASSANASAAAAGTTVSANTPVSSDNKAAGSAAAALRKFNKQNSWLYILCTAVLFALPILIYRYAIRRRPMESKNALMIVLFYGMGSIALLALITVLLNGSWAAVGVVLIWHIASYFLLTGEKKKAEPIQIATIDPTGYPPYSYTQGQASVSTDYNPYAYTYAQNQTPVAANPNPQPAPQSIPSPNAAPEQTIYCEMCGMHLNPGSKFCPNCGEKVSPQEMDKNR